MSRFKDEDTKESAWKPTLKDASDLSAKLEKFEKRKVNGKMQYPYELFLESEKVVSFGEFGEMRVMQPILYKRYGDINALRIWKEDKDQESMFQAFPEEREKHQSRIAVWMREIREMLKGVDKKILPTTKEV